WFLDRLEGGSPQYNIAGALRLKGRLDVEALEKAIETIVERHESLRTRFEEVGGEASQVIEAEWRAGLPVEDLSRLAEEQQQERIRKAQEEEATRVFDLANGPVLRVKLLKLAGEEHILLRTMHHIVSDGWSESIFNRELTVLYE